MCIRDRGITDAWMWAREPKAADGTRPGIRESLRWTEGYERIAEMAATMPATRLVYIADRGADIAELMQRAHTLGNPADWLIRSQHNRCLPDGGKLWTAVLAGSPLGKIELALAVYMVVSWRLARLVRLGRTHPDLAATMLFTDDEWKGAYILAKKPVPKTTPTLREVIRRIAMLGGFLARKSDGEPGVKTLWLGFQRLRDFVDGVEHMRSINAK